MISQQVTSITNWYVLHRMKPQFLSRIASFTVFGDSGGTEVLLILKDGTVWGFGLNRHGCLALGHKGEEVTEPTEIVELRSKQVVSLVAGTKHVIALTASNEVFSWGDNSFGQTGTTNTFESLKPTLVGRHIVAVACGANHTLTLTSSGQIFSFGRNNYGQIGNGTNHNQMIPMKVTELESHYVTAIACGSSHSLALTSDGSVWAWGNNSQGQLGNGNCSHQTTPVQVKVGQKSSTNVSSSNSSTNSSSNSITIKAIAAGMNHSLLLSSTGEIWAMGRNREGELGSPSVPASDGACNPVKVSCSSTRFKAIAADFASNLSTALSQCGFVFVWGELAAPNEQVGSGPEMLPRQTPLRCLTDAFAIYSKRKCTGSLVQVSDESVRPINRIVEKLARSFDDPKSSDLTFLVEGRPIHVHRWFLKISSKYFERMLSEAWCTPETSTICIEDYSYPTYLAYLRYIYTDCIEVSTEEAVELLDLANCYLEDDLKAKCCNILRHSLSAENCCLLYQLALQYGLADFERAVVTYVLNNLFEVCRSAGFRAMDAAVCKAMLINVSDIA